jgi:hypothetical protein
MFRNKSLINNNDFPFLPISLLTADVSLNLITKYHENFQESDMASLNLTNANPRGRLKGSCVGRIVTERERLVDCHCVSDPLSRGFAQVDEGNSQCGCPSEFGM